MKILHVAKAALYGIFLNYYCYYVIRGTFIPMGTVLFFAIACFCVGTDVLEQGGIHMGREVKSWILYAVLALITTSIVLLDSGKMDYLGDIAKYVQRLLIIIMIAHICQREHSARFGLRLMAVTALALAVSVIMMTDDIQQKLNLTSGADLSANDTGAIMAFGCFAIPFAWGRRDKPSLVLSALKTAGVICCVIVIFLTGSRKSILAVAVMLVVLVVLCLPQYSRRLDLRRVGTLAVIGVGAYLFITANLLPYAEQTNLYARLMGTGVEAAGDSDIIRVNLYIWALEDFFAHPFFGVGFDHFRTLHGNYTHSTYMEPLACSGLIGLLYLYPYYSIVRKQIYLIRRSPKGSAAALWNRALFAYLCMMLFVAVGIPYMYKDAPCILLGTLIASQAISFRDLHETGSISADH